MKIVLEVLCDNEKHKRLIPITSPLQVKSDVPSKTVTVYADHGDIDMLYVNVKSFCIRYAEDNEIESL